MKAPIPILRIFDVVKATEFYTGFLGFKIDWKHEFQEGCPVYMQISREVCVLHLSEHHGDGSPGSALRIETPGLDAFVAALQAKNYKYFKPGKPSYMPWGSWEIEAPDPFGNRLVFYERKGPA